MITKEEALALVDNHRHKLTDPELVLEWTWLRVMIYHISAEEWMELLRRATPAFSSRF